VTASPSRAGGIRWHSYADSCHKMLTHAHKPLADSGPTLGKHPTLFIFNSSPARGCTIIFRRLYTSANAERPTVPLFDSPLSSPRSMLRRALQRKHGFHTIRKHRCYLTSRACPSCAAPGSISQACGLGCGCAKESAAAGGSAVGASRGVGWAAEGTPARVFWCCAAHCKHRDRVIQSAHTKHTGQDREKE
jgi:hypothetical protein